MITLLPELIAITLTLLWMLEKFRANKREKLAQKTLELIASDRARTRAGCYDVRWQ